MKISFTGHRPDKLGGYSNTTAYCKIREALDELLEPIKDDIEEAYIGMALGFDQYAAEACLDLDIPVVASIPCLGQEKMWPDSSKRSYADLLSRIKNSGGRIDQAQVQYSRQAMMDRNKYMIDRGSDMLVACWNGTSGGTGNAVNYAMQKGVDIVNIYYDAFPPLKVSTGRFWDNCDGCKVAISRSKPKDFTGKSIPRLAPSADLLNAYKEKKISWEDYVVTYKSELDTKLKDFPGVDTTDRLVFLLKRAGEELGSDHLVLCCWEKEGDNCHRYIVADLLPDSMLQDIR